MAIPRLRYAFYAFGDLRLGCAVIFGVMLLISIYFSNKYIGMNITSRVLQLNPSNMNESVIKQLNDTYISTSEKGSFAIGSVSSLYFILSIYGLIGIFAREIYLLIAPMVILPLAAFIMFVLIFFDLGIQETTGFLFFWVFTGLIVKIMMIGGSIYSFLVVFSYYMEITEGPQDAKSTDTESNLSPDSSKSIKSSAESKKSPSKSKSSAESKPSPESQPSPKTPLRIKSPKKTPPPRPPSPKLKSPRK